MSACLRGVRLAGERAAAADSAFSLSAPNLYDGKPARRGSGGYRSAGSSSGGSSRRPTEIARRRFDATIKIKQPIAVEIDQLQVNECADPLKENRRQSSEAAVAIKVRAFPGRFRPSAARVRAALN